MARFRQRALVHLWVFWESAAKTREPLFAISPRTRRKRDDLYTAEVGLDRQDAASRRPHFSHHASKDPVPPRGTLDRFLLRTEQTGWPVAYCTENPGNYCLRALPSGRSGMGSTGIGGAVRGVITVLVGLQSRRENGQAVDGEGTTLFPGLRPEKVAPAGQLSWLQWRWSTRDAGVL